MSTLKGLVLRAAVPRPIRNSFLLLLFAGAGLRCRRESDLSQGLLTGKLVIADACGLSAIQVLSGPIDSSKLSASWTDPDNDSVFHQVFKVSGSDIYCNLAAYGLVKGDTLQFELNPHPPNMVCMECADFDPPSVPPIYNAIRNVKKLSSAGTP